MKTKKLFYKFFSNLGYISNIHSHLSLRQQVGRIEEDISSWALVLDKDTKKNLMSYPWQKQVFWRKNRKNISRKKWTKPGEALTLEWWGVGFFKTGLLHIHLGELDDCDPTVFFFFFFFREKSLNLYFIIIIYFTILYWFCHTSTYIRHGCTRVPHPEPPSHLPPHTIPLGHPSAPAPSFLYPASNLDWWFVSYMIWYMF